MKALGSHAEPPQQNQTTEHWQQLNSCLVLGCFSGEETRPRDAETQVLSHRDARGTAPPPPHTCLQASRSKRHCLHQAVPRAVGTRRRRGWPGPGPRLGALHWPQDPQVPRALRMGWGPDEGGHQPLDGGRRACGCTEPCLHVPS